MDVELMVVGAHDGTKLRNAILAAKDRGAVVLVEPVPHLFAALERSFGDVPNVFLQRVCIAPVSGPVAFHALRPADGAGADWGTQLGSLRPNHAARHDPQLADRVERIRVDGVTFTDLIGRLGIVSIRHLLTDTEGYDCVLLQDFPFLRVRPKVITFEFKHADGTFTVGRNLALLLLTLEALQYEVKVLDAENFRAVSRV